MRLPLEPSTVEALGLDPKPLGRLRELVTAHITEGRYPAAQIAIARHGKLGLVWTLGDARLDPQRVPARDDTLWLLYSNTKVLTACAVWILVERGALAFTDRIADHVPGFEANGKGDISVIQLLTHQGGFPNAEVPPAAWEDHELLRRSVSTFTLEWTPGSRVHYHRGAAHWVAAVLIEALTKTDYRAFIREHVTEPLGLGGDLFVGLPDAAHDRAADTHEPAPDGTRHVRRREETTAEARRAGTPGGGGYGTARAMAAFYQMLLQGGQLGGARVLSPRTIAYVTRTAVLRQDSVVPSTARATVIAIEIIRPKPMPPRTLFPTSTAMSPIGALEAAAAAMPVTAAPVASVPASFSDTMKFAAKYSIR